MKLIRLLFGYLKSCICASFMHVYVGPGVCVCMRTCEGPLIEDVKGCRPRSN